MYGVIETELFRPSLEIRWPGGKIGYSSHPHPWVARITGHDPKWGLAREFMRGTYDYTRTNNAGTRGTRVYYAVPPGVYEVDTQVTWGRRDRYFCRVDDNGDITEITREEVDEWLNQQSGTSVSAS